MPHPQILLLEDDPVLGHGIQTYLELQSYQVCWLKSLADFQDHFSQQTLSSYDLMLLDVMLPDANGLKLCQMVAQTHPALPVLMITAKTDEDAVIAGLASGARDYLRKPFGNRELLARIQVHLPRSSRRPMHLGPLQLCLETRQVWYQQRQLKLNRRQFDLLVCFVQRPDQVLSRHHLLDQLGMDYQVTDRTIDSHISQLRSLLRREGIQDIQIVSVYGLGYRLCVEPINLQGVD